jgi:hypothetical protein
MSFLCCADFHPCPHRLNSRVARISRPARTAAVIATTQYSCCVNGDLSKFNRSISRRNLLSSGLRCGHHDPLGHDPYDDLFFVFYYPFTSYNIYACSLSLSRHVHRKKHPARTFHQLRLVGGEKVSIVIIDFISFARPHEDVPP